MRWDGGRFAVCGGGRFRAEVAEQWCNRTAMCARVWSGRGGLPPVRIVRTAGWPNGAAPKVQWLGLTPRAGMPNGGAAKVRWAGSPTGRAPRVHWSGSRNGGDQYVQSRRPVARGRPAPTEPRVRAGEGVGEPPTPGRRSCQPSCGEAARPRARRVARLLRQCRGALRRQEGTTVLRAATGGLWLAPLRAMPARTS